MVAVVTSLVFLLYLHFGQLPGLAGQRVVLAFRAASPHSGLPGLGFEGLGGACGRHPWIEWTFMRLGFGFK